MYKNGFSIWTCHILIHFILFSFNVSKNNKEITKFGFPDFIYENKGDPHKRNVFVDFF